ncbi:MAG: lipopolysaccharide biosynthesis protein RfbH [archaeon YNP-WB-062]|jgi:CDP-6-deoxy-D-xylo-4-hexulose-3-dehydrase|nr:lipopolysaccharide biosynthesis protein RfbH [Candidatus Culexarchaeum yellowstonense]
MSDKEIMEIKRELFELLKKFFEKRDEKFIPGKTAIHYAQAIYDHNEVYAVLDSLLSGWLGIGKYGKRFEEEFSKFLGAKHTVLTNSGSSANLLAVEALKLPQRCEAITPAVTFPTTLNPLIQKGIKPVFVDVNLKTYNVNASDINDAISKDTKLIMLPHTLGNPNEMDAIMDIAEDNELYVIEDACDALGSRYDGKYVSTFGNLGTFSFYAAHHITMGEGGAVVTNEEELALRIRSLRDWGRACVCDICKITIDPNAYCPLRFSNTPIPDYDKRYTYIHIGYNLKPLDLQAAFGLEQLKRLPYFIDIRKKNFKTLYDELLNYEDYFILPESLPKADPCWFAFPLTIKDEAPFNRKEIVEYLEKHKIMTRPLFAGNILKQPAYANIEYRISGELKNSEKIMKSSFFIGIHPGINDEKLNYMINTIREFIHMYK